MTLTQTAAGLEQGVALRGGLDALGDDAEVERLGEVHDRSDERGLTT